MRKTLYIAVCDNCGLEVAIKNISDFPASGWVGNAVVNPISRDRNPDRVEILFCGDECRNVWIKEHSIALWL